MTFNPGSEGSRSGLFTPSSLALAGDGGRTTNGEIASPANPYTADRRSVTTSSSLLEAGVLVVDEVTFVADDDGDWTKADDGWATTAMAVNSEKNFVMLNGREVRIGRALVTLVMISTLTCDVSRRRRHTCTGIYLLPPFHEGGTTSHPHPPAHQHLREKIIHC